MAYEMVVGLQVTNEDSYSQYRKEMTPLLEAVGGGFRYDFRVSETLKSENGESINRLFLIHFPDQEIMNSFFLNSEYKTIKERYFEGAVETTSLISGYDRK